MSRGSRTATPVALVTGAGRGIGRATAEAFAGEGYRVVLAELQPVLGRRAARALTRRGADALFIETDVADPRSVELMARLVRSRLGRIDCLVNNAGVLDAGPLVRLRVQALERMLAVNLAGPLLVTRSLLPAMLRRHAGAIVNVASLLGKFGAADYVTYCASKFRCRRVYRGAGGRALGNRHPDMGRLSGASRHAVGLEDRRVRRGAQGPDQARDSRASDRRPRGRPAKGA